MIATTPISHYLDPQGTTTRRRFDGSQSYGDATTERRHSPGTPLSS